jgi:uncharacterized protein YndB with AHSA1/START domain
MSTTIHLHRVLRSTPDKVYRAFLSAAALAKWLPPYGFVCHVHQFVSCGTDVRIEQAGIPEAIPADACHLGWQESLAQLAHLVEPDIAE